MIREAVDSASPALWVVGLSHGLLVAAVLGEAAWRGIAEGWSGVRRIPVVASMAAGAVVVGAVVTRLYVALWPVLAGWAPAPLRGVWDGHPLLGALGAFVAWDLAGYWYHRIGHRTRLGWASHQVHHTGDRYDLTLAWRQSWLPLHAVVIFPLLALGGFRLEPLVVCAAVSNLWQALVHTAAPVRLPSWVVATLTTPVTHRRHHAVEHGGATAAVNLAPVLTLWDRLGGTWDPRPVAEGIGYGIEARRDVGSAVSLELAGWRELLSAPSPAGSDPPRRARPAARR